MPRRTVFITDNGGTPFVVHLPFSTNVSARPGVARIMNRCNDEDMLDEWTDIPRTDPKFMDVFVPWKSMKFTKAWVGLDPSETEPPTGLFKRLFNETEWWHGGNSMLLQTGARTFVHVGDCIFKFQLQPKDEVVEFVSPMGNSAVPYPFVTGKNNTYLLTAFDKAPICIPNELLDLSKDPYDQFFNVNLKTGKPFGDVKERSRVNSHFEKKHRVSGFKMLHERDALSSLDCRCRLKV